jgi:hypothetical protein
MGIFDNWQFPGSHQDGILGLLQQAQQYNGPQQQPAAQSWPESPTSYSNYGGMKTPVFGAPPEQQQISAQQRMPQQQVPAPQQQPAPQQDNRFSDGLEGFVNNLHTGPIGSIVGAISGFNGGDATSKALRSRGIDEATIKAAKNSPAIMAAAVQQAYGTKELTNDIKQYQYAVSQGYKGPFVEFLAKIHQDKAIKNNVQIDQSQESEFGKTAGKLQATRFNDLAEGGQGAKQMVSDVELLRDLGTKLQTGKMAEVKAAIGPYAEALGVDVKNLNEIQAFEAVVNRVAPSLRVKGAGAQSDMELRNFLKSLPSLGNTPGGNEIITQTLEGLARNKIAAADIGARALSKEITPAQAEKELRGLPDPMEGWRKASKGGSSDAPKVRTYNPKTGRIE